MTTRRKASGCPGVAGAGEKQYEEALNVYKEQRAEKRKRNVRNTRNDLLRVFSTDRASRAAADIKNITGVDTAGNQTVLEQRMAEHILRRHGEDGKADSAMEEGRKPM